MSGGQDDAPLNAAGLTPEQAAAHREACDPFGDDAWRGHQPGCRCPDCEGAREDARAAPGALLDVRLPSRRERRRVPVPDDLSAALAEIAYLRSCTRAVAAAPEGFDLAVLMPRFDKALAALEAALGHQAEPAGEGR